MYTKIPTPVHWFGTVSYTVLLDVYLREAPTPDSVIWLQCGLRLELRREDAPHEEDTNART